METRKHPRFAVKWPVTYGNGGLFGNGTVENVSQNGCRIAGRRTAAVGMRLKLSIVPAYKDEPLCVEDAQVRWVKDYEFGVEFRYLPPVDHRELMGFLETAKHRQSFEISVVWALCHWMW